MEQWIVNFWTYTDKRTKKECWNWKKSLQKTGYGNSWNGVGVESAHRVSYRIHFGTIKKGFDVMHLCDNKRCVNPNHLKLGTRADNMRDASEKGRCNNILDVDRYACGAIKYDKTHITIPKLFDRERYANGRIKYDQTIWMRKRKLKWKQK